MLMFSGPGSLGTKLSMVLMWETSIMIVGVESQGWSPRKGVMLSNSSKNIPGACPGAHLHPSFHQLSLCYFPLTVLVGVVVVSVQIPPLEGVGAVLSSQGCPNSWVAWGVQAQHRLLVFLGWVWEEGSHRCQLGTDSQGLHSC